MRDIELELTDDGRKILTDLCNEIATACGHYEFTLNIICKKANTEQFEVEVRVRNNQQTLELISDLTNQKENELCQ